ncbi:MAG: phosphodiester glycosidase family protein [Candidatus Bipolaricaulota bacterium]|nr:phosphodiester glycosidase family protein [Candidatus Bipolaricaulota bacterium]
MKSGLRFIILAVFVLAVAVCVRGGEISLYVDGELIVFSHPVVQRESEIFVPLREIGLPLGIETALVEEERSITIRSADNDHFFPIDHFPLHNGVYYISLEELVSVASARMHVLDSEIYIESDTPHLTAIDASANRVSVRFDGFVPYEVLSSDGGSLHLRFYHCTMAVAPHKITVTGGVVSSVALTVSGPRTADLIISLSQESLPQIKRFTTDGFYSVSLTLDHQPSTEMEETIAPHITYHEITTDIGAGSVKVKYLYIDEWRDHYKLVPATSENGIGTLSLLQDIARSHAADAAINGNFYDTKTNIPIGLLIVNGQILSSNYERRAALGIDLFGRLSFLNPQVSLYLRTQATKIAIDDVDRPIRSGDLIMFTAGYSGPLTSGFVDSFHVVKIRNDRVTSVQDGPYVIVNPNADLLVACGSARSRINSLRVGDEVNFEYTLDQGDLLITDAVSAGPLLYHDGNEVLSPQEESFIIDSYLVSGRAARSLLATDWYGGLILLTVIKNSESVGTDFAGLLDILGRLPVKVKNAIAFDGGHSSSLVFKDGPIYREISSGGKVAVGLLLVPTDR